MNRELEQVARGKKAQNAVVSQFAARKSEERRHVAIS
jgi:hypothetical protein